MPPSRWSRTKRLFTSAPKDVLKAVQPKEERFPGAHRLGWRLLMIAVLLFVGAIVYGGMDGIRNHYSFRQFFFRFLFMLVSLKAFDVLFFDWFLLCHSQFFPHYYPEVSGLVGPHQFGFNWRSHLLHFLAFLPVSAGIAWICVLFSSIVWHTASEISNTSNSKSTSYPKSTARNHYDFLSETVEEAKKSPP